VVQEDYYAKVVELIIQDHLFISSQLAAVKDHAGRPALNIASPACQKSIKEALHFYQRYDIMNPDIPRHRSATCMVHLAIDHGMAGVKVALKFMQQKDQFMRELGTREQVGLGEQYVIKILRWHDSDTDDRFKREIDRRGFTSYPYCIVMPAADRSLTEIISSERVAGRDWQQVKVISSQIAEALKHMHGKKMIHGDIKPLNIMRVGHRMKLIDLDASASTVDSYSGAKYSSGYSPPELIYNEGDFVMVKTFPVDPFTGEADGVGLPYKIIRAHPAHDAWSFGVVLYQLCSGTKLFLADDEDNIDIEDLIDLEEFKDSYKRRKLSKITDPLARNLVGQLLNRNPLKRPRMSHVLSHPFFTGQKAARLIGEPAEFDVFLSYRFKSDFEHASLLYHKLTENGLKVWWDKKCLKPGVSWEDGFCDGLVKSRIFMPIISRGAINHASDARQNITMLTKDSPCDNVLLEYRLALELEERDLIERIHPLLFGDLEPDRESGTVKYKNYFSAGCHPNIQGEVVVDIIEDRLEEHLARVSLGTPLFDNMSVAQIMGNIMQTQVRVVEGPRESALETILEDALTLSGAFVI
jgi:serine/threonine protein kinase